jgi:hypothetical protein
VVAIEDLPTEITELLEKYTDQTQAVPSGQL